jgi:mandelate racemase
MNAIRGLRARAVNLPMRRPLATAGGFVNTAPLVLLDLETEDGVTGRSYVFCYTPLALKPVVSLLEGLGSALKGDALAPYSIERKLQQRFRLLGPQGLTGIAMAAIDMAAWDALAQTRNLPLVCLLGGEVKPVQAYNSCGLGLIGPVRAAREAEELAEGGFRAIKVRLGYGDLAADIEVLRAVRQAVGERMLLMTDYNQGLSVPEALVRAHALDGEGVYWIEEPTTADDYTGHALIRNEAKTLVQLGENWWGPHDMTKSIAAGASDLVMVDAVKIGGVTGWQRAAALAESHGLPVSSHLFPEISAHLLAVTPTAHWLEYVDWASDLLEEPVHVENGHVTPGPRLQWNEKVVASHEVHH